ncbi:MAG: hypothetical protein B7Y10_11190 [Sphingomonadales bacterium 24-56-14]|nr:MAG: hypothetical protein B7Y10_11190 [Sphingomonadales bacterium 24-56-14]
MYGLAVEAAIKQVLASFDAASVVFIASGTKSCGAGDALSSAVFTGCAEKAPGVPQGTMK